MRIGLLTWASNYAVVVTMPSGTLVHNSCCMILCPGLAEILLCCHKSATLKKGDHMDA